MLHFLCTKEFIFTAVTCTDSVIVLLASVKQDSTTSGSCWTRDGENNKTREHKAVSGGVMHARMGALRIDVVHAEFA
jgi:hypothetical protein